MLKLAALSEALTGRVHLLSNRGSPIGLDLELLSLPLKISPKSP